MRRVTEVQTMDLGSASFREEILLNLGLPLTLLSCVELFP